MLQRMSLACLGLRCLGHISLRRVFHYAGMWFTTALEHKAVQGFLFVMSGFAPLSIIGVDLHRTKQKKQVHMVSSLIEAMVHYGTIDEHSLSKLWYATVQFAKQTCHWGYLVSTFHPCRMRHHGSAISRLRSHRENVNSSRVHCGTPCSDFKLSSPQQRQERPFQQWRRRNVPPSSPNTPHRPSH
jgi:hypothetical protein